jgi:2-iminobutanoate/2-iminopropanoate deaminase
MSKQAVHSSQLPPPKGPYSPAIRAGDLLFVSGLGPTDPATGTLISGDFAALVRRTLDNLALVLEAGGARLDQVVKTTVYLTNLDLFPQMNEVYATYFGPTPPARTTIEASRLPAGLAIEIDAIAYLG